MFTTQAVRPGQLLALSQPLASVALRPTAVAAGPSKLIQALLQVGATRAGPPRTVFDVASLHEP